VIPAYNEERYLGRCRQALCAPSHPASRFEIIGVDNSSSDGIAEIARRFGARVISEPRKGVAYARQTGFEAARCKGRFSRAILPFDPLRMFRRGIWMTCSWSRRALLWCGR